MPNDKSDKSETTTERMGNALSAFVRATQEVRRAGRARTVQALKEGMKTGGKVLEALEEL